MLRWTAPEIGDTLIDVVQSLSLQCEKILGEHTALAVYSNTKATMHKLDEIYAKNKMVMEAVKDMPGHEGDYLRAMTLANDCVLRVCQGDNIPYLTRCEEIQELTLSEIPQKNYDVLAESISKDLGDMGYKGNVAEKIQSYLADTKIPADKVTTVAQQYIDRLKQQTLLRVTDLPEDDEIKSISGITGVYWSGFSAYPGDHKGTLTFNIDRPWSVPTFVNVLAHEGYPGHQTFYCKWDWNYQRDRMPLEAAYYLTNSPTNAMFEGCPENALNFLGWVRPEVDTPEITAEEKKAFILGRDIQDLQRIIQTNANFYYNGQGRSAEEVKNYITSFGIFNEVEATNTLRFFGNKVQCTYYPAYYYGTQLISKCFALFDEDKKSDFYKLVYDKPQTTKTLIKDVEAATGKKVNFYDGI